MADFDVESGSDQNAQTNSYDAWLVKYDVTAGCSLVWKKIVGAQGWDYFEGLQVDDNDNVFMSGSFAWTVDFSPENPGQFVFTSDTNTGGESGFFMKYNSSGVVQWVRTIGNVNSTGSFDEDEAQVTMRDLCIDQNKIMLLMEGTGQILMDGVNSSSNLPTGSLAAPGVVLGEYDMDGNWISACNADTSGAPIGFFGGLGTVGLKSLSGNRWIVAGTFHQRINFSTDASPVYLETDPTSPNYGFDKDIYVVCYAGSEGLGIESDLNQNALIKVVNPIQDHLQILGMEENYSWKLYNGVGKLSLTGNRDDLYLGSLETGLYILEIKGASGLIHRQRVIKN